MTTFLKVAGLPAVLVALCAAIPPGAYAEYVDLQASEGRAVQSDLGSHASAIAYWECEPDGWHVVTTVDTVTAPDTVAEQHAVVRFDAVLLPGQSQTISVPSPVGNQQRALRISRSGDKVVFTTIPDIHLARESK